AIDGVSLGPDHPSVARDLNNLAQLLQDTNRLDEAEPLMRRAVGIFRSSLGDEHPHTQGVQRNYDHLLAEMQKR
ncbi:MAG: tetratricopeptide repeat protein, partial [Planctomycetaceae bacterium]|nr:tetratricopeptide repeat protein [Planctomycetaceae bacterium]